MWYRLVVCSWLAMLPWLSGCGGVAGYSIEEISEEAIPLGAAAHLHIEMANGSVKAVAHSGQQILAKITRRAVGADKAAAENELAKIDYAISSDPSGVTIRARHKEDRWHQAGVSIELSVPAHCSLKLRSSNAAVSVEGMRARLEAATTNGAIQTQNCPGPLRLESTMEPSKSTGQWNRPS